jgi:two-component system, sensor histidine kinase
LEKFVPEMPVETYEATSTEHPRKAGLNVLVAEDNLINQRLIAALLVHHGHRVVVVNDGEEAVSAVGKQKFDVVLMDMHMPNMDGVMATRRIRAMPGAVANLPIVAVTANAKKVDRAAYIADGLTGFVAKPIDPAALMAEIDAAIKLLPPARYDVSPPDRSAPTSLSTGEDRPDDIHDTGSVRATAL